MKPRAVFDYELHPDRLEITDLGREDDLRVTNDAVAVLTYIRELEGARVEFVRVNHYDLQGNLITLIPSWCAGRCNYVEFED